MEIPHFTVTQSLQNALPHCLKVAYHDQEQISVSTN